MKFRYWKFPLSSPSEYFGHALLKPVIPVEIFVGERSERYAALIDSGADLCIFDAGIAETLGLRVDEGCAVSFGGVQDATPAVAYLHEVGLAIGGNRYTTNIGFSYDIAEHGYGLLGNRGFFDLFVVKFDLAKEEIELKKRSG